MSGHGRASGARVAASKRPEDVAMKCLDLREVAVITRYLCAVVEKSFEHDGHHPFEDIVAAGLLIAEVIGLLWGAQAPWMTWRGDRTSAEQSK